MSKISTSPRRLQIIKVAPAVHIPLSVLAAVPACIQTLSGAIRIFSSEVRTDDVYSSTRYQAVRLAFCNVVFSAEAALNAFAELNLPRSKSLSRALRATRDALALMSAVSKASGNIDNLNNMRWTFKNDTTTEAVVQALHACATQLRSALKPFGY